MYNNDPSKEHWHLDKRLNVGHLMTTIAMVIAMFLYVGDIEKEVIKNRENIQHIQEIQKIQNEKASLQIKSVIVSVDKIDAKIDKLIERHLNGQ